MKDYQVVARKYRPQFFRDVLGQEALVATIKNALKSGRLAQAYLFSGSRGTGKTTIARLLAKALNCPQLGEDYEPCNTCSSCHEIALGNSLDVLEIDGASHRGIEDIRQINETVGYASSCGRYKIYIIDEVHMLTKEAFNALLKTLEEPPPKVKFIFATTEPHKVLPTIVSRCQRFNLNRIPTTTIVQKLKFIASELNVDAEEEALQLVATMAEGGLRDAESLLDQIFAFHSGKIDVATLHAIFGLMPKEAYFILDQAGKQGDFAKAFEIVDQIFKEGKDLTHFLEGLIDHFRSLLMIKLSGIEAPFLNIAGSEKNQYETSAKLYSREQCLTILEFLLEAQQQIRFSPSPKIALEGLLLKILRTHFRLPVEVLVQRLCDLEKQLGAPSQILPLTPIPQPTTPTIASPPSLKQPSKPSFTEDPTPSPKDVIGFASTTKIVKKPVEPSPPLEKPIEKTPRLDISREEQSQFDTKMQFAAIELEGTLKKNFFKP